MMDEMMFRDSDNNLYTVNQFNQQTNYANQQTNYENN